MALPDYHHHINPHFSHLLHQHYPLMASPSPTKPLNPYADPFLSAPPPPPPPPHVGGSLMYSSYGNLYYPRAATTTPSYYCQFHAYPAVSYYNAWPQVIWPPSQAAAVGGAVTEYSKHVLKREFVVSSGPRGEIKPPPKWVEKRISSDVGNGGDGTDEKITTLMIKNIPNQLKRHDLLRLLDRYCQMMNQQSCSRPDFSYDFLYLPMDFRRGWYEGKVSNLGYAFVNFTTSIAASQFCTVYNNHKWDVNVNKKICEITHARIQGKKALTNAFKNKIFWCDNNQSLPVMLSPPSNGRRRYQRINVGRRIARLPRKPIKKFSS